MTRPSPGFDATYDVVVVGFGGAGATAAIEASEAGARVLVLERFGGGGATRLSGGVVYAGGGSALQRAAGFEDSPEAMRRYLEDETEGAVAAEALEAFAARSLENLAWLAERGAPVTLPFYPQKTTQPPDGYGLYFSGNELERPAEGAKPAPRGHVVDGPGMTGRVLFAALADAAVKRGVEVWDRTTVTGLTTDADGAVTGVTALRLPEGSSVRRRHAALERLAAALAPAGLGLARPFLRALSTLERRRARPVRIAARGGVIVASGGFVFDGAAMRAHAPAYAGCMPLGTPGDDGAALRLGAAVGAATAELSSCAASRFLAPPEAFLKGILVNQAGRRFVNEGLYGATLSRAIARQPGGRAWLVIDQRLHDAARAELAREERLSDHGLRAVLSGELNHLIFRKLTGLANLHVNRVKAASLVALAHAAGIHAVELEATVARHDERLAAGAPDDQGKRDALRAPLAQPPAPPWYAIGCDLASRWFPGPCITLGGLATDGTTARVLSEATGRPIPGLYAAGRAAAGICSRSYVSGLSLADCIFSGRNAGHAAALRARSTRSRRAPT